MRLAPFIREHLDAILKEWEDFAATLAPLKDAHRVELRDHATAVLQVIATDLDTTQEECDSIAKSKGQALCAPGDTAAEVHAAARMSSGLTGEQVMAEFRALRASVLRLWSRTTTVATADEVRDMVRFNEAIDQAQTESMTRYALLLRDAQSLFLAILGHDVRSPLGAVSMAAQVLLHDTTLPPKVLTVSQRIFNSCKRVDEIVRDLLDFSTSHLGGGIPIDPYPVHLGEICLNVVEEARTFHPNRSIELVSKGNLDGHWDGPRLAQAFSNLISNALEHGKPDSVIHVRLDGTQAEVVFEVQNDAEFISAAKLNTLFDPVKSFAIRPAHERTLSRVQNLGLGLYVVKEIVKAHEGHVAAVSTHDAGVKFSITLPRKLN